MDNTRDLLNDPTYYLHDHTCFNLDEQILSGAVKNSTGFLHLPFKCEGKSALSFVDSGCSFNAVTKAFAAECQLEITECEQPLKISTGGGKSFQTKRLVAVAQFEFEGLGKHEFPVFVMDPIPMGCDAIFGMDFLKLANPVIDWKKGVFYSRPQLPAPELRPAEQEAKLRSFVLQEQYRMEITHREHMMSMMETDYDCGSGPTRVIGPDEYEKELAANESDAFFFIIKPEHVESEKSQRYQEQCWERLESNPAYPILLKYKDSVFQEKLTIDKVSDTTGIEHEIDLIDDKPVSVKQFRLSPEQQAAVTKWTAEMTTAGLIRPSTSPYSSPIFCVKKPVGWRIVHDYRILNSKTRIPKEPIPRKDDIIDTMEGAHWFSCMDLLSGYYQLMLREEDRAFTAFSTPTGHYEYLVTAQGLAGAPATFNRFVQRIFEGLKDISRAFFDNIYVYTKNTDVADHLTALDRVLNRCKERGLSIKLAKCVFVSDEIPVLGDFVGRNGVRMDPDKVAIIKSWPTPRTRTQIKSFLGTIGYCARFCKDYGKLVAPLHQSTQGKKKNETIDLTVDQIASFNKLKTAMSSTPTLALPNFSKPFGVRMDASDYAIGGVLYQFGDDGEEHPVAFAGRKLNRAEINYSVREKELLAIIYALRTWRIYLLDQPFTVETDHQTLQELLTQRTCSQRLARWLNLLSEHRPEFKWIPGHTNDTADGISRREDFIDTSQPASKVNLRELLEQILLEVREQEDIVDIQPHETEEALMTLDIVECAENRAGQFQFNGLDQALMVFQLLSARDVTSLCKKHYGKDKHLGPIWKAFLEGGQDIEKIDRFPNFSYLNGLLWYAKKPDEELRLCIPRNIEIRNKILFSEHDDQSRGHPGVFKTSHFVTKKYYWKNMHADIKAYVGSCEKCQRNKHRQSRTPGQLNPLPVPEARWQHITMDFILNLPECETYNAIWVIVDRLTKRAHFIPLHMGKKESNARMCSRIFQREYQRLHGIPETIISDRDTRFTSEFWKELMILQGSIHKLSSAFKPSTDGQTERTNRFIEDYIRNYIHASQDNWVELLYSAELTYNSRIHDAIGMSPFEADLGYVPRSIPDHVFDKIVGSKSQKDVLLLGQRQQRTIELLKENLEATQVRMSKYYNRNRPVQTFEVGAKVMISSRNLDIEHLGISRTGTEKFGPLWIGPYPVLEKISIDTYRLQIPIGLKLHPEFHTSLLKPYVKHSDPNRLNKPNEGMIAAGGLVSDALLIEDVIDHRRQGKKIQYLVTWLGYPASENSWEDQPGIYRAACGLINNYLEKRGLEKSIWNPHVRRSRRKIIED